MICTECDEPVSSSYTQYPNGYIKLTDCPQCHRTADKYIEVDNVVLFIDILLLKPQAYKHLVFNADFDDFTTNEKPGIRNWLRTKKIQRVRILSILFDIYLSWAYQEKDFNAIHFINPYSIYHNTLTKSVIIQYFIFGLKCVIEDILTHTLVSWFVFNYFKWSPKTSTTATRPSTPSNSKRSPNRNHKKLRKEVAFTPATSSSDKAYLTTVISLTILISNGTKLFPILMLIWPYDNLIITNIIVAIANFNLIESLRIVTGLKANQTCFIFGVITIAKFIFTRIILSLILSLGDWNFAKMLLLNEGKEVWATVLRGLDCIGAYV